MTLCSCSVHSALQWNHFPWSSETSLSLMNTVKPGDFECKNPGHLSGGCCFMVCVCVCVSHCHCCTLQVRRGLLLLHAHYRKVTWMSFERIVITLSRLTSPQTPLPSLSLHLTFPPSLSISFSFHLLLIIHTEAGPFILQIEGKRDCNDYIVQGQRDGKHVY